VQTEPFQGMLHRRLRLRQVQADLGVFVQQPAQRHRAWLQGARGVEQAGEPGVIGERWGGHLSMIASPRPSVRISHRP
jgi:hypothetical protein